jgi:Tfp pilus assembly ATPase PilU
MKDFIAEILTKDQMETFERERELDFVISLSDIGRFRMNIYRQRNSVSLSARLIYEKIPSTTDLGLPEWIADYVLRPHGLVLISGADDALSMDGCIAGLCFEGKVSFEDGLRFADNPASYQELIRKGKF